MYLNYDIVQRIPLDPYSFSHTVSYHPNSLDPLIHKFFIHTHEKHEFFYFLSGQCVLILNNERFTLSPGDACFIPAGTKHSIEFLNNSTYERMIMYIPCDPKIDSLAAEIFSTLKLIPSTSEKRLASFFARFKEYYNKLPLKEFSELAPTLVTEMLYICSLESQTAQNVVDQTETILKKALEYINENYPYIQSAEDISNAVFISLSYLYRIFNNKLKTSPKNYLLQKRMQMAQSFLISGVNPTAVSEMVGFKTYTAFFRSFKAFFGVSPAKLYKRI